MKDTMDMMLQPAAGYHSALMTPSSGHDMLAGDGGAGGDDGSPLTFAVSTSTIAALHHSASGGGGSGGGLGAGALQHQHLSNFAYDDHSLLSTTPLYNSPPLGASPLPMLKLDHLHPPAQMQPQRQAAPSQQHQLRRVPAPTPVSPSPAMPHDDDPDAMTTPVGLSLHGRAPAPGGRTPINSRLAHRGTPLGTSANAAMQDYSDMFDPVLTTPFNSTHPPGLPSSVSMPQLNFDGDRAGAGDADRVHSLDDLAMGATAGMYASTMQRSAPSAGQAYAPAPTAAGLKALAAAGAGARRRSVPQPHSSATAYMWQATASGAAGPDDDTTTVDSPSSSSLVPTPSMSPAAMAYGSPSDQLQNAPGGGDDMATALGIVSEPDDPAALMRLEKLQNSKCCSRGCLSRLTEDMVLPFLRDVLRMDKRSRELYILILLQQCREHGPQVSRKKQTRQRQRDKYNYNISPVGFICHDAFIQMFGVTKGYLDALQSYLRQQNSVIPRVHGNWKSEDTRSASRNRKRRAVGGDMTDQMRDYALVSPAVHMPFKRGQGALLHDDGFLPAMLS